MSVSQAKRRWAEPIDGSLFDPFPRSINGQLFTIDRDVNGVGRQLTAYGQEGHE